MITHVAKKFPRIQAPKETYTTGEIARLAHLSTRTVAKLFDQGYLQGYRIPGSLDRRIPRESLLRFLKQHNIPLGELAERPLKLLLIAVDEPRAASIAGSDPDWECHTAQDAMGAAFTAGMVQPDVVVIDFVIHPERACRLAAQLKAACGSVIVGVTAAPQACPAEFDDLFHLPCDPGLLASRVWSLAERRRCSAR